MSIKTECESDSSEISFPQKRRRIVFSSSEDEIEDFKEWHDPRGNQPSIMPFTCSSGFRIEDLNVKSCVTVGNSYELFVPDELFEDIAKQTNLYASRKLEDEQSHFLCKWIATNKNEMKRFIGLLLWMGLVRLPSLHLYWSCDPAYMQTFPKKIMSKSRFEILLRMLHFTDNSETDIFHRLCKIQPLLDKMERNFKKYYDPSETICINESFIPFRSHIIFRQYLKQNHRKYGIKLVKLCCESGYTYAFRVYPGKSLGDKNMNSTNVVMSLCGDIFNKGHTLYTDNCYTSLDIANKLLDKNTHLVGTLRSNQWGIPYEVTAKKLKQGEIIAKENKNGITILKWKDKQDILLLSTKHTTEMVNVENKSGLLLKPKIVVDYKAGKTAVNISHRASAYNNPLQKSMKWYKKLALELLLNTTVLNAYILFKYISKENINITEFRKNLAVYLTNCLDEEIPSSSTLNILQLSYHELEQKTGRASKVRKYCKKCYQDNATRFDRNYARKLTKQVTTFCKMCIGQPFLCIPCFNSIH